MSEEGASPEKKEQNQIDTQVLRAWLRAMHIHEDEISELMRETAIDERSTADGSPAHPMARPGSRM
jgi:hypothetical protein